jgi:release factor glutamine methyltransferase
VSGELDPTGIGAGPAASRPTVGGAIADASARLSQAGSESARLDAEVLLGHVLGVDRVSLSAYPEAPLGDGHAASYRILVERRATGEPVAYIRGLKEFYGLALHVDPRVLIPRPETETLVDLALERITTALTSGRRDDRTEPFLVWDVGTGSGAIAIALASALRRRRYGDAVRFHLSDVSPDALTVAVENAVSHGVADLMDFGRGDLLAPDGAPTRRVDLLVANLPYVPASMIPQLPVAASFEPTIALDGGEDGLTIVRRLLAAVPPVMGPGSSALLEIGSDQADEVLAAAEGILPGWSCTMRADLSGAPRVIVIEAPVA